MNAMRSSHVRTDARWGGIGLALLGLVLLGHTAVQAQTAQVTASLGNFDVVNYTTHPTHGYEVEIEGASISTTLGFFCEGTVWGTEDCPDRHGHHCPL